MSSTRTGTVRRVVFAAVLLAFAVAQGGLIGLVAPECVLAVEEEQAGCGDCCPDEAPATDECGGGCDACSCCPGVAPAVPATPFRVATLALSDPAVDEVAVERRAPDSNRIFRPPRAGVGC